MFNAQSHHTQRGAKTGHGATALAGAVAQRTASMVAPRIERAFFSVTCNATFMTCKVSKSAPRRLRPNPADRGEKRWEVENSGLKEGLHRGRSRPRSLPPNSPHQNTPPTKNPRGQPHPGTLTPAHPIASAWAPTCRAAQPTAADAPRQQTPPQAAARAPQHHGDAQPPQVHPRRQTPQSESRQHQECHSTPSSGNGSPECLQRLPCLELQTALALHLLWSHARCHKAEPEQSSLHHRSHHSRNHQGLLRDPRTDVPELD